MERSSAASLSEVARIRREAETQVKNEVAAAKVIQQKELAAARTIADKAVAALHDQKRDFDAQIAAANR